MLLQHMTPPPPPPPQLNSREYSSGYNAVVFRYRVVLKFCIEHGAVIILCSMRYAKYQNDWTADMDVWYARTIFREIFNWSRVLTGYPILQHILGGWWPAAMTVVTLLWRHYGRVGVSNHQPHDCLLNRSFRHRFGSFGYLTVFVTCGKWVDWSMCQGNAKIPVFIFANFTWRFTEWTKNSAFGLVLHIC